MRALMGLIDQGQNRDVLRPTKSVPERLQEAVACVAEFGP